MKLWKPEMLRYRMGSIRRGATAVEYGLMVALIAAGIILVVLLLGDQLRQAFQYVTDQMQNAPR